MDKKVGTNFGTFDHYSSNKAYIPQIYYWWESHDNKLMVWGHERNTYNTIQLQRHEVKQVIFSFQLKLYSNGAANLA